MCHLVDAWAKEAGPSCARKIVPFWTWETGPPLGWVWLGMLVPVVVPRFVRFGTGRLVPVGLGRLAR